MLRPYRIVAALVLCAVGGSIGVSRAGMRRADAPVPPPSLLAAAYAAPLEVAHADTLKSGETLSQLMERTALDLESARALLAELTRVQDPRKIRPGLVVEYRTAVRDGAVRKMATRLDADRSLAFTRGEAGWTAEVREVPVRADTAVLTGRVRLSLYQAMMEAEGDIPADERGRVVDLLADRIFAWKIDFSRDLKPDDSFRILYERMVRPDGTARSGKILAVELDLGGRRHDAFLFTADGTDDYFDRDGESLRRAFLRAPLEFRRISSSYSTGRFHPVLRRVRPHNGIDYAASSGTPDPRGGRRHHHPRGVGRRLRQPGGDPPQPRLLVALRAHARLRLRHPPGRAGAAGRPDRLRRLHRHVHGAAPALRVPRERPPGEPHLHPPPHRRPGALRRPAALPCAAGPAHRGHGPGGRRPGAGGRPGGGRGAGGWLSSSPPSTCAAAAACGWRRGWRSGRRSTAATRSGSPPVSWRPGRAGSTWWTWTPPSATAATARW
jgi:murein DD-endopeptidase MepM/ murein hydrolase activator NlpD